MRLIIIAIISLITTPALAANLPGLVFEYECALVEAKQDGFTCKVQGNGMYIHFTQDFSKLPKKERAAKKYRYNALLLRYFDLGGINYQVTANYWKQGERKHCSRVKGKRFTYVCE